MDLNSFSCALNSAAKDQRMRYFGERLRGFKACANGFYLWTDGREVAGKTIFTAYY
jgi:hypothetical protein